MKPDELTQRVLAFAAFGGLLLVIGALIFLEPPAGSREVLYVLVGALSMIAKEPFSFFFGSSKGSRDKMEIMKGNVK